MAISKHDLELWLKGIQDDTTLISIYDDGGLCLVAKGAAALEVGGIYIEDEGDNPECECHLCGERFYLSELMPIKDYWERVGDGEPAPAGKCPDCGALCHEVDDKPETVTGGAA